MNQYTIRSGRIGRICLVVIIAAALLLSAVDPSAAKTEKVEKPTVYAGGAVVYCENTGETIFSQNAKRQYDPYSITKLMTALLAVQHLPLDKTVTVSEKAAAQGESTMDLVKGEKVTVEQLLYGALLLSGNDAAYALGEAVSGNMTDFVRLMNKTARNIGCRSTHFENATGIQSAGHYTTAADFMQITRVALSNSTIRKVAGTRVYRMDATNKSKARTMKTHVPLVNTENSGVYAGKTGLWQTDDCTLAVGYEKNGLQLFIVLLKDTEAERTNDLKKLIQYAENSVQGIQVVKAGKETGKVRIRHGAVTRLQTYTAERGYAYLPKEGSESLISTKTVMKSNVQAPVKAGQVVGYYNIYVGEDVVNKVPLVVRESVEEGWFPSYIGISNRASMIIGAVLLGIIAFLIWAACMRARARRRRRELHRRRVMRMAEEELRREQERNRRDWNI